MRPLLILSLIFQPFIQLLAEGSAASSPLELKTTSEAPGFESFASFLITMALFLALMVLVLWGATKLNRKLAKSRGRHMALKYIGRLSIDQKNSVVVIQTDREELILGNTPHQITVLDRRPLTTQDFSTVLNETQEDTTDEPS